MGESLVAFRHPVCFFLALDRPACVLGGVEDLERKLLGHALPAPLARETHDPAAGEGQPPPRPDLDRDPGGGAAAAARLHPPPPGDGAEGPIWHPERAPCVPVC